MKRYNFYPGPSELHPKIGDFIEDGLRLGYANCQHRSKQFESLYAYTEYLFKQKLGMPEDFQVFWLSSSTECWETLIQSFPTYEGTHFIQGDFGNKWANYRTSIRLPEAQKVVLDHSTKLQKVKQLSYAAFTQCETSNGKCAPTNILKDFKELNPDTLVFLDMASSFLGMNTPFQYIDAGFFSVQKCIGMPPGLGVLFMGEKVRMQASESSSREYNSLRTLLKHRKQFQTTHTIAVFQVYLLMRILEEVPDIQAITTTIVQRNLALRNILFNNDFTVTEDLTIWESPTVIRIPLKDSQKNFIQYAAKEGLILGEGYGDDKGKSCRIALFPSMPREGDLKLYSFIQNKKYIS